MERVPLDPLDKISPALVPGERLVLRVRLSDGSATDLIGWVQDVDAAGVLLDRGRGTREVTVERSTLIAARRVPAAPGGPGPATVSAAQLEGAAADAWVADTEQLGEWLLRAAEGFTSRANSCLAVGDPGRSLADAAAAVEAYYRKRGLPPWVQVVIGSAEERALRDLGWNPTHVDTDVLATRLAHLLGTGAPPRRVAVSETLTADWLAAYRRSRPAQVSDATLRTILAGRPPTGLAAIRQGTGVVAIGRAAVRGRWCGVSSIWTDPHYRGHGHAGQILPALGHWAARAGARNVYLQVAADNADAQRVYARLGFIRHHSYRYLVAPDGDRRA